MEKISYHGNKAVVSLMVILALAICSMAATYRLKKTAQIRLWEKSLAVYSERLEEENNSVINGSGK